jgi:hypothetical protein
MHALAFVATASLLLGCNAGARAACPCYLDAVAALLSESCLSLPLSVCCCRDGTLHARTCALSPLPALSRMPHARAMFADKVKLFETTVNVDDKAVPLAVHEGESPATIANE